MQKGKKDAVRNKSKVDSLLLAIIKHGDGNSSLDFTCISSKSLASACLIVSILCKLCFAKRVFNQ